jgi:arylsulfatase A
MKSARVFPALFLALCLSSFTLALPVAALGGTARAQPPAGPNIILILADDLGYADVGSQGAKHPTPHLDRMAREGVRLTSFYSAGNVCTPTRSSLMTGSYPARVGLHRGVLFPGYQNGINTSEVTIAELLKSKGYATSVVGKWHLGDQPEFLPTRHGFDEYFGIPFSNDMGHERPRNAREYPPLPLLRGERVIETEPDQRRLTRRYTEESIKFIEQTQKSGARPFFLYLAHAMPHWPHYSSEAFDGKSGNGKYGDAVTELDWSTGEILAALKRLRLDEKTLVVFLSDNGGPVVQGATNTPLRGAKATTWEGGHRVPFIARWPKRIPAGNVVGEMAASFDLYTTFAKLGGASNPADRVIDGRDILPLLTAKRGAAAAREAFFYFTNQGRLQGVRSGKWKLLLPVPLPTNVNPNNFVTEISLFDLETDLGEAKNVAPENPQVVKQLQALLDRARADLGDFDKPGAGCRPAGFVKEARPLTSGSKDNTR